MCDRCVSAWGKLPSASPLDGSTSSARSPTSFAAAIAASRTVRASPGPPDRAAPAVVAAAFDRSPQLVARAVPAAGRRPAHALLGQPDPSVERRPTHDLGVHEVLRPARPLPDASIRIAPALGGVLDQRYEE